MKELSPRDWPYHYSDVDVFYREAEDAFPALRFQPQWEVRIIPPRGGAVVRFLVRSNGREISVYGDYYSALGVFGNHEPYWEMYPRTYIDDQEGHEYQDTERFPLDDAEGLLRAIDEEFRGVPYDYRKRQPEEFRPNNNKEK